MTEMEIVIAPASGQRQADVFTAHWGDILLATRRTPFFDSARKLLEIGAQPSWRSPTLPIRSVGGPERDLGEDRR